MGQPVNTGMSKNRKKQALIGYLYLLPNFVGFFLFIALPVFAGLVISFTNYAGFPGASFVGFANYMKMLGDTQFLAALKNNIAYSLTSVPLTMLFALIMALMLNQKLFLTDVFKTLYFFPNLTSTVAISCVFMLLFEPANGPVNRVLAFLGVPSENLPGWFFSTKTALITVVTVVVWKQAGYYMIMFLAGLKNIPPHLYEAARIDGANKWQCFCHVTWPMLSPTTFMVTILSIIASFQVFDIINLTTRGGPGRATTVLVYRIYREAFRDWQMGYASAIAYFLFMIILVITLIQWQGQKKWVNTDD